MTDGKLVNQGLDGLERSLKNLLAHRGVLKQLAVIGGSALVFSVSKDL